MVLGERVAIHVIQRQHAESSVHGFHRDGDGCLECGDLAGIVQIARLHRGVSVQDGLVILGYPAGESLAHGNLQRPE